MEMIRITILYPASVGARFDMDYYLGVHAPRALSRLGGAVESFTVDVGIHAPPMSEPLFVAAGHYLCASAEEFMAAYLPHAAELQADVANYTDIKPIIQVSEVRLVIPAQS
ncbi:EthD family reductase [Sphingopyxis sp.]|uniref:EthD family reductase n=1 Tax=Sphingopyxis sp. TaxID=1908224 RepID=UPI001D29E149|nr:EthD family reductase [Sphingopyxis sp.]MBW8294448.1 EthD family reductase [Sphingopyxis sp.]